MRYCFYWLANQQTDFGKRGLDWFSQNKDFFQFIQTYFPQYETIFFEPALKLPRRYGFHTEFYPPFTLKPNKRENDLFEILKRVTQSHEAFDVKLQLASHKHCVFFEAAHNMTSFFSIVGMFKEEMKNIIDEYSYNQFETKFRLILSHTINHQLTNIIREVSEVYWDVYKIIPIHCDSISLCYQRSPHESFQELTRLPLKLVY